MIFKKKRSFHVSYHFLSKTHTGIGSIIITIEGKLTAETMEGIREYINSLHPDQTNIIIALTRLE